MEITIHNVLDGQSDSGDYTMLGVGGLELPTNNETIEAIMRAAGVSLKPYTAAAFGYRFKMNELNGRIIGNHTLTELNQFARYLASLREPEREQLARFAARFTRLTPVQCMIETPLFWDRNEREFVVALLPEEYHSSPSIGYLHLPATAVEFIDAIDRARTDGRESYIEVREVKRPYLRDSVMERPNLYELNYLAERLTGLTDNENLFFEAMVRLEKEPPSVPRLINLTYNLENCVLTDAGNHDELGRFAVESGFFPEFDNVPELVLKTIDYEQLGARFKKEQNGVFVDDCFIANLAAETEMAAPYNGKPPVPDLKPRCVMRLLLEYSQLDGDPVYLDLPASIYDINLAAKRLGWESLSGHDFMCCQSSIPRLDKTLSGNEDIHELADFAETLESLRWNGELQKYKAALEIAGCSTLADFAELAERLDQYEFRPEIVNAYDYGEWELLGMYKLDHTCPGMQHFDFAAFGRERLGQQGDSITPYGLISKKDVEQTLSQDEQADPDMGGIKFN